MTQKSLYTLLLTTVLALSVSCSSSAAKGPAQMDPATFEEEVSVKTVAAHKGKPDVVVLDVREPHEYADAHIPGVLHIPMGDVMARKSEFIDAKTVFVTCRSGNRSGAVTDALRKQGHTNVHNMAGGIRAWKSMDLPVETGN